MTFLIADVRGYTTFTQERGDEAAGALAERFARTATDGIEAHGGSVVEVRGDEVLAAFESPRQAVRGAVELQRSFVEETERNPDLPLRVGIGLDVGEATTLHEGYRGGALNRAARLCSLARGGEVLATSEVTHMAGRVDGVSFRQRGRKRLKGLSDPVLVMNVAPTDFDPVRRHAEILAHAPRAKRHAPSRRVVLGSLALGVVIVVVVIIVWPNHVPPPPPLPGPSPIGQGLIRIDPAANKVSGRYPFENTLTLAVTDDAVWISSHSGMRKFIPSTGEVVGSELNPLHTLGICNARAPCPVVAGGGSVWFMDPSGGRVARVDPTTDHVIKTFHVGFSALGGVYDDGALWVLDSADGTVVKIDARRNTIVKRMSVSTGEGPTTIAAGEGAIWVVDTSGGTVSHIDPRTGRVVGTIGPLQNASGVAVGAGRVWVIDGVDNSLTEYDSAGQHVLQTVRLSGPTAIVYGAGYIWVAENAMDAIIRIDPASLETRRIRLSDPPADIAVGAGAVWVTPGEVYD
jgi:class 3 adenylate cyclase